MYHSSTRARVGNGKTDESHETSRNARTFPDWRRSRMEDCVGSTQDLQRQSSEGSVRAMLLATLGDTACACPACGFIIERADGDDTMMCGCDGRPAGGTTEKAFAGGGCGHEFHFVTGAPLGCGSAGNPANERQWKFVSVEAPIGSLRQLPTQVLDTLQRILQNIVNNPASARYRTLPLNVPKIASLVSSLYTKDSQ